MGADVGRADRESLRALASAVAEIAALPLQQETRELWRSLNRLEPVRPMALMDEIPWHEMAPREELALRTEDPRCRDFERTLRRTLYAWRHFRLDMVVEPVFDVGKVIRSTGFGVDTHDETAATHPDSEIVSHDYADQLADTAAVECIRPPIVSLDVAATEEIATLAREIFDGILEVRMQGWVPHFELWDDIVRLRGAQRVLYDLAARPEHMHAIAERYTNAHLAMLDGLEQQGLLGRDQALIHCTGAWTDELPADGYDPASPRTRDLWGRGMAQIMGSASPAMLAEFELPYAVRWYERFGLVYYGCCEPLHDRVDLIRGIPNLRKISMSPWADVEAGAAAIGHDYVFAHKPNPADVARSTWDPEAVERGLRRVVAICRLAGCPLEITLKDISTVAGKPQRLWEWSEIARRVLDG